MKEYIEKEKVMYILDTFKTSISILLQSYSDINKIELAKSDLETVVAIEEYIAELETTTKGVEICQN